MTPWLSAAIARNVPRAILVHSTGTLTLLRLARLAVSAALTDWGIEHLVLERSCAGETWRRQRWDSFRLNTPGWMNQLLGEQSADAYLTGAQVAGRLERLAAAAPSAPAPVVTRLTPDGDGLIVRAGDTELRPPAGWSPPATRTCLVFPCWPQGPRPSGFLFRFPHNATAAADAVQPPHGHVP
jgi:hypothetical protein